MAGAQVYSYSDPAENYAAVTPSDTVFFDAVSPKNGLTRGLYVGVAGDLTVYRSDKTAVTFSNAPVGYHPIRCIGVKATGTVASGIVRLW